MRLWSSATIRNLRQAYCGRRLTGTWGRGCCQLRSAQIWRPIRYAVDNGPPKMSRLGFREATVRSLQRDFATNPRDIRGVHRDIEPLSLDEAYLDVTENLRGITSATEIARQIKARIRPETQLTASAGVSYNKFLAKLASDYRKPDGLYVITPDMGPTFVEKMLVERFHGVGPATAAKMKELEIFTARDVRSKDEAFLLRHFGKAGSHFYCISHGIDHRPVLPNRVRKSLGAENTFYRDLRRLDDMEAELRPLIKKVWQYCHGIGVRGRTVTLKLKFTDFKIITRSRSCDTPISDSSTLESIGAELLAAQLVVLVVGFPSDYPLSDGVSCCCGGCGGCCVD